jgi:thiopurine S-methyltransferase
MEHSFWHKKWDLNEVGFHLDYAHPVLERHLELFAQHEIATSNIESIRKVFVPLCGKTLDIGYLMAQGYEVVAVELSEIAVEAVFQQLNLVPEVQPWKEGKVYQAEKLTIFAGDFFTLSQQDLGAVTLVYDRAALIALPEEMRVQYTQHIAEITQQASQLLITLDYDQSIAGGPPFAVDPKEVEKHYAKAYSIKLLEEADIIDQEPRFKAKGLPSFYQRGYQLIANK